MGPQSQCWNREDLSVRSFGGNLKLLLVVINVSYSLVMRVKKDELMSERLL